jgi:hypothetical protein
MKFMSTEFRVDGIPCRQNSMSTEFSVNVFIINIYVFFLFKNALAD